jgi:hypothetical protein
MPEGWLDCDRDGKWQNVSQLRIDQGYVRDVAVQSS